MTGIVKMEMIIREYKVNDFEGCCLLQHELALYHADIYDDSSIADCDPEKSFKEYLSRTDRIGT